MVVSGSILITCMIPHSAPCWPSSPSSPLRDGPILCGKLLMLWDKKCSPSGTLNVTTAYLLSFVPSSWLFCSSTCSSVWLSNPSITKKKSYHLTNYLRKSSKPGLKPFSFATVRSHQFRPRRPTISSVTWWLTCVTQRNSTTSFYSVFWATPCRWPWSGTDRAKLCRISWRLLTSFSHRSSRSKLS